MRQSQRPDLFKMARRVTGVSVHLRPDDIIDIWQEMDAAKAAQFLHQHGTTIAAHMLAAGRQAAADLMQQEGGAS